VVVMDILSYFVSIIIIIIIISVSKIPVLRYSFGIVNWHQEELQN